MTGTFHDGNRVLQDRFDTRRIADRIDDVLVRDTFSERDRAFIETADYFFIATADGDGMPNCSYEGGDPGFVGVIDERTIAFPNYEGNGMYLSMGNVLVNPSVGLLFIDSSRAADAAQR
jgi:predicted pyridoxine 5'-phosphate oxidase superfamily flavin-nucleotide-binding protein